MFYHKTKKLAYEEFLELLCEDELDNRRDNNYKRRYNTAKLPTHKKLEDFDFSFQASIDEREIIKDEMTTAAAIDRLIHHSEIF